MPQSFVIKGVPRPQARPRLCRGRVWSPGKKYKENVALQVMAQKPKIIESGPVGLVLVLGMPRPKYVKKDAIWHTKKPDIDNLAKAVMDALNGILWKDDSQICELSAVKVYDVAPGIQLEVTEL